MPQFTHPLHDHILTRGFAYKASLYVGGQHAAADYVRETGRTRDAAIISIAAGSVVRTNWDYYSGFLASVDHGDGWMSTYRHLIKPSPLRTGQPVTQGQLVGNVGNTGASLGDHLHFDLWNREKHDPTAFYKNGWWAHDPVLYLGEEEKDEMTDEQMNKLLSEMRELHKKTAEALQAIINHQKSAPTGSSGGATAVEIIKEAGRKLSA